MNTVKIYKQKDEIPTFIIESENIIDSSEYIILWDCKEEIYIDKKMMESKYHTI